MIPENVSHEIEAIVGQKNFLFTPEDRWTYAYDSTDLAALPDLVVFPGNAEEIAGIVRLANKHGFPVVPRGAGTGRAGGSVPIRGGVVLVMTRLNRILEINPEDMVAVVEPGVVTGVLKRTAAAQGLYYPPDPSSADFCTIGGNVATGAGGAMAVQYGVTRDYVLGLTVVLPTGEIIEAGAPHHEKCRGLRPHPPLPGLRGHARGHHQHRPAPGAPAREPPDRGRGLPGPERGPDRGGQVLRSGLTPTAIEFMDRSTLTCVRELLAL